MDRPDLISPEAVKLTQKGTFIMATSSIFHNIVIKDEATAMKFIDALEASKAHPVKGTGRPIEHVLANKEEIHRLRKLWEEKHGVRE